MTIQYGEPIRWERSRTRRASSSRPWPTQILVEIRRLYAGLEAARPQGDPARALREQRRAERRAPKGAAVA